jgi:hypothetical protein
VQAHLKAFTAIDPTTGWFEISFIPDNYSDTIMDIFRNCCLTQYPWPTQVTFDNGTDFKAVFQENLLILALKVDQQHPLIVKVIFSLKEYTMLWLTP